MSRVRRAGRGFVEVTFYNGETEQIEYYTDNPEREVRDYYGAGELDGREIESIKVVSGDALTAFRRGDAVITGLKRRVARLKIAKIRKAVRKADDIDITNPELQQAVIDEQYQLSPEEQEIADK